MILVFAARSILRGGAGRRQSLAVVLGFGAPAILGVAGGIGYLHWNPSGASQTRLWVWFVANVLVAGVAVRALRIVRGQHRDPIRGTALLSVAVGLVFVVGAAFTWPVATHDAATGWLSLACLVSIACLPAFATRRAGTALPILFGLLAALGVAVLARALALANFLTVPGALPPLGVVGFATLPLLLGVLPVGVLTAVVYLAPRNRQARATASQPV
jgi:hypothetical protein